MTILLLLAAQAAGQPVTTYYPAAPTAQAAPAAVAPATTTEPASPPAASAASPAPAESNATIATSAAPHGLVLWRNIESGMTVAQLRALYPQGSNVTYKDDRTVVSDVSVIEGCQAKVNVMHPAGVVEEIVMRGEGSIAGRCSIKIITALSGKYGEPLDKDKVRGSIFARQGKNYIWTHDGVTLQLKRYTNGPLGGGGLFAASWELRYSGNASSIDL